MIVTNDNKYRGSQGESLKLDEYSHVEKPFLEQLIHLGWASGNNEVLELDMEGKLSNKRDRNSNRTRNKWKYRINRAYKKSNRKEFSRYEFRNEVVCISKL